MITKATRLEVGDEIRDVYPSKKFMEPNQLETHYEKWMVLWTAEEGDKLETFLKVQDDLFLSADLCKPALKTTSVEQTSLRCQYGVDELDYCIGWVEVRLTFKQL